MDRVDRVFLHDELYREVPGLTPMRATITGSKQGHGRSENRIERDVSFYCLFDQSQTTAVWTIGSFRYKTPSSAGCAVRSRTENHRNGLVAGTTAFMADLILTGFRSGSVAFGAQTHSSSLN